MLKMTVMKSFFYSGCDNNTRSKSLRFLYTPITRGELEENPLKLKSVTFDLVQSVVSRVKTDSLITGLFCVWKFAMAAWLQG